MKQKKSHFPFRVEEENKELYRDGYTVKSGISLLPIEPDATCHLLEREFFGTLVVLDGI